MKTSRPPSTDLHCVEWGVKLYFNFPQWQPLRGSTPGSQIF